MRKSFKVLSILLLVCLLVTGMVIASSAETVTATGPNLNASTLGTGITNHKVYDYDTTAANFNYAGQIAGFFKQENVTRDGNKYLSIGTQANPTATGNHWPFFGASTTIDGNYFTVDFDIANVKFDNNFEYIVFAYFNGSAYEMPLAVVPNADYTEFYASMDFVYDENDIKLSSAANVWNHITYVVSTVGDTAQKAYVFVDGEYLGAYSLSAKYTTFSRFNFRLGGLASKDYPGAVFSLDVDNIAMNKYSKSYTSGDNFGLDDLISGINTTTMKLDDCADVIYNKDYVYRGTAAVAEQAAVRVELNGAVTSSYVNTAAFNAALSTLTKDNLNGATVVARKDISISTLPKGVASLTVVCNDGAELNFASENHKVVKTVDGATTTYVITSIPNLTLPAGLGITAYNASFKYDCDATTPSFVASGFTADVIGATEDSDRTYVTIRNKAEPTAPTSASHYIYRTVHGGYPDFGANYAVFDFDIANVEFNDQINCIELEYRSRTASAGRYKQIALYIVANAERTEYYASLDATLDGNDIKLTSIDGVWTHITYVISAVGDSAEKIFVFVDGEYLGYNNVANASTYTHIERWGLNFNGLSAENFADARYSIDLDNIVLWIYDASKTGANGLGGLITALNANPASVTKKLYDCNYVLYNSEYWYRDALADQAAVRIEKDGKVSSYVNVNAFRAALAKLTASDLEGATIVARKDVDLAIPYGVNKLTLVSKEGAKINVTSKQNYNITETVDGATVTHALAAGPKLDPPSEMGITAYNASFKYDCDTTTPSFVGSGGFSADVIGATENPDQTFVTIRNKETPVAPTSTSHYIYRTVHGAMPDLGANYAVFDFDIANVEFNEDINYIELAYWSRVSSRYKQIALYIVANAERTEYYASLDATLDGNDIRLSSIDDVWNHITYVISPVGDSAKKIFVFVDGEYLGYNNVAEETTYTHIERWGLSFNGLSAENYADARYSIDLDNIVLWKYSASYTGDYSLRDLIPALNADPDSVTKKLYDCCDVVYSDKYNYKDIVADQAVAKIETNNATPSFANVGSFNKAFAELTAEELTGATIVTRKNIFITLPDDIEILTVICNDGAKLQLPDGLYYDVVETVEGATTTYVLKFIDNSVVTITWELLGNDQVIFSEEARGYKGAEFVAPNNFLAALADLNSYAFGDYKWMIDIGNGFEFIEVPTVAVDYESKVVTVRIAAISVTWLDASGNTYATETWFAGNTITPHEIAGLSNVEVTGNGWYNYNYTTWELDGNDMINKEFVAEPLTPLTFTAKKTPVPAYDDVKLNMSLLTKFEANLYLTNRPLENVTLDGIFTQYDAETGEYLDNVIELLEVATLDGNTYYLDNFFFDNSAVDKVVSRFVQYTVIYEGGVITIVDEIEVSLLDYAEKVVAQYGCGSEEANLIYNLINYSNAAYALKTGADYDKAVAFLTLEGHEEGCACRATYEKAPEEVCIIDSTLGENVLGWTFDISNEQPAFVVYVNVDEFDNALVEDIELAFFGIDGMTVTDVSVKLVRGDNVEIGGKVYATFYYEDMALYNAAEIFTVTVIDATTGEVVVTNYSLATYIDYAIYAEVDAAAIKVAEALYSFAKVAKDYKIY